jgi:hypothetical protein
VGRRARCERNGDAESERNRERGAGHGVSWAAPGRLLQPTAVGSLHDGAALSGRNSAGAAATRSGAGA